MMRLLFLILLSLSIYGNASVFTTWTEKGTSPIYNPFSDKKLTEDYYPCVLFDKDKFQGHGGSHPYKMWHQGKHGTIALSWSDDGVHWHLKSQTNLPAPAEHPCVLYFATPFGADFHYKIWYWTGVAGTTVDVIQYAESHDGIHWTVPVPITQYSSSPLVDGVLGSYFYHLYGPGFILFNSAATSEAGKPFTFPYVLFYDTASEGEVKHDSSIRQIALAYSTDGKAWKRFGSKPILIPPGGKKEWDATDAFRPSIVQIQNTYQMFYSGSNRHVHKGVTYAHGIGHASSTDGITWTRDSDNPIFLFSDGVEWRNSRTYTPFVLYGNFSTEAVPPPTAVTQMKMWFTGGSTEKIGKSFSKGSSGTVGKNQGIGYATLANPVPSAPSAFAGTIVLTFFRRHCMQFYKYVMNSTWTASTSPDVTMYKLFRNTKLIRTIPASGPLTYSKNLHHHKHFFSGTYTLKAVNAAGLESSEATLTVTPLNFR